MAEKKIMYTCIFPVLMLLSLEVQPSEGRRLRRTSEKGKECLKCAVGPGKTDARIGPSTINVHEFRPTAPGHSPGLGHSLKDKGVDKNESEH
ncbi:hypothetical protein QJS10_CPA06g02289 [Acorus calamus]|uniref:Uncharacterized protein n=1 Tax=Acorus calamus TaxID=4465 RepID=A0AAV9EJT7_ACOCL|nr:hypothetical protein QJS10_CPA06g02289 [Acorus calamus]